ncbi:cytochrome c maturation protein CcmE [uncultured Endozoicomonas sp.]|uniref:cytochrome c maturation protein CcmE n=1 Tax=uncultured Endozoicomonas sp. TaxID=432652 RepID=UPI00260B4A46|nr:cytochrome c maturation protein CcmE [uncultured Endozoicomonas sp.]
MNAVRKQRLILVLLLLLGVGAAVTLMLFALQENINHYFSPAQMESGEAPTGQRVRGGGLVVPGSVERDTESLQVSFRISDGAGEVTVLYDGILPDLFVEGSGIVATGMLNKEGVFTASEVLAKHDENYMPPEVQKAIDDAHPGYSSPSYSSPALQTSARELEVQQLESLNNGG